MHARDDGHQSSGSSSLGCATLKNWTSSCHALNVPFSASTMSTPKSLLHRPNSPPSTCAAYEREAPRSHPRRARGRARVRQDRVRVRRGRAETGHGSARLAARSKGGAPPPQIRRAPPTAAPTKTPRPTTPAVRGGTSGEKLILSESQCASLQVREFRGRESGPSRRRSPSTSQTP